MNRSDVNKLDHRFEKVKNATDTYVSCCEKRIGFNCTCFVPGVNVSCWNAETNDPEVLSGVPPETEGILYITCQAGSTEVDGYSNWEFGDYLLYVEDAGQWFQNKAESGSGYIFQSIVIPYESAVVTEDFRAFSIEAITLQEGVYWNLFSVDAGLRVTPPFILDVATSDPLPLFLQAPDSKAVVYTFPSVVGTNANPSVTIYVTDNITLRPEQWIFGEFATVPLGTINDDVIYQNMGFFYAT